MEALNNPLFGLTISFLAYEIGKYLFKKTNFPLFNPLLVGAALVIGFLYYFSIPLEYYSKGGDIIEFFLIPGTVLLAVPLYKQLNLLKKYYVAILVGGLVGSLTTITSTIILSKLLGLDKILLVSFIPKSITTPIGIEVSKSLGGIPPITIFSIVLTGICGNIFAVGICKMFKVRHPVAKGVAIGISSHAGGTTKAMEMGEVEGAMSALSIVIAGVITLILSAIIKNFIGLI
ncbi:MULTISPECIES: LrgB family protein [Cetobacterium]|uniref:LrgB family protein n=1 Tax=Candidatus Cetobacterium colombiensis TaxID=3073100 RepID=A0ABU4WAS6_9FUSO|nr:LrgB family protein [Candidatus Cetobacterium colombiensis]MDX8336643.1 LrgB family protein [Candidatus Cetobacterium colombiensis]